MAAGADLRSFAAVQPHRADLAFFALRGEERGRPELRLALAKAAPSPLGRSQTPKAEGQRAWRPEGTISKKC